MRQRALERIADVEEFRFHTTFVFEQWVKYDCPAVLASAMSAMGRQYAAGDSTQCRALTALDVYNLYDLWTTLTMMGYEYEKLTEFLHDKIPARFLASKKRELAYKMLCKTQAAVGYADCLLHRSNDHFGLNSVLLCSTSNASSCSHNFRCN